MRALNVAAVMFLVLLLAFVFMVLDRFKVTDSRIRYLEERVWELQSDASKSEISKKRYDYRGGDTQSPTRL